MDLLPSVKAIVHSLYPNRQALPRRQPGQVELDGRAFHYVDQHSLFYQFLQIFLKDMYGFRCDRPDPYIVDAGAHVGIASLYFAQAYPRARIDAFEADPAIADVLGRNMANFAPSVRTHPAAVWVDDAGISFSGSSDDSGHVAAEGSGTVRVPTVRLRDVIAAAPDGVDMLKLDVEGAEFAVIEDCRDVLSTVERMIIEAHQLVENSAGLGRLLSLIEESGFKYTVTSAELATWIEGAATPFLACPTDRYILTIYAWRPGQS